MKAVIILSMLLLLATYVLASASAPDSTDIEGYYDFDSNLDDYFDTHNLIVSSGSAAYSTTYKKTGTASMDLQSAAWYAVNNTYSMATNTEIAFTSWINNTAGGAQQYLMYGNGATDIMYMITNGGQWWIGARNSGGSGIWLCQTASNFTKGWHNLALVYDGPDTDLFCYVDGVLKGSSTSFTLYQTLQIIQFGHSSQYGVGTHLDQGIVWNTALDNTGVKDVFNDGSGKDFYPSDLTQINLSTINMTSDEGCTVWSTGSGTCNTTDGRPTITVDTTSLANCSISDRDEGYNASIPGSTSSTASHILTLSSEFTLAYGLDNLYIGCEFDAGAVTNKTSALAINMTAGTPGEGGEGLVSCISEIGPGCGVVIDAGCADVKIT